MSKSKTLLGLILILCQILTPALAKQTGILQLSFSHSFGGNTADSSASVALGLSAVLPDELRFASKQQFLPVTGLSYSTDAGLGPMLMGMQWRAAEPGIYASAEESPGFWRSKWMWLIAGGAVLTAVVLAGAASDAVPQSEDPENNCGVSGDVIGPDDLEVNGDCAER